MDISDTIISLEDDSNSPPEVKLEETDLSNIKKYLESYGIHLKIKNHFYHNLTKIRLDEPNDTDTRSFKMDSYCYSLDGTNPLIPILYNQQGRFWVSNETGNYLWLMHVTKLEISEDKKSDKDNTFKPLNIVNNVFYSIKCFLDSIDTKKIKKINLFIVDGDKLDLVINALYTKLVRSQDCVEIDGRELKNSNFKNGEDK